MTIGDLLPLLTQSGVFGVASWVAYRLHRDAVAAHRERANDWREVAKLADVRADRADARADLRDEQVRTILEAIKAVASR